VQVTQFIEQNKKDFEDLKAGTDNIKSEMQSLDSIV
jgi:hypothetical protein